jgi:hypothetical protein
VTGVQASGAPPEWHSFILNLKELPRSAEQPREIDFADHPGLAALHRICAQLMMFIGPVLWAALIVLFVWAEFFAK